MSKEVEKLLKSGKLEEVLSHKEMEDLLVLLAELEGQEIEITDKELEMYKAHIEEVMK